jgi:MraZ protein
MDALRGNYAAKIDDKGRLKIPTTFRSLIEREHGTEVFVTSLTGQYVRLYPMPVWNALEHKLRGVASTNPSRDKFLQRVNYFGQASQIDTQGRIVIHARLRDLAAMAGEVDVLGQVDVLDIWNRDRLALKIQNDPYEESDARALSDLGI